ncbi:tetrapyrrole biosynthesis, uroporphyrinogen III synthase [Martensiomyces pterosporus]|nr:tetrapyrrole biosynthesis, uroporphyrinogen III synthase [Martensiomyces pterosporus]
MKLVSSTLVASSALLAALLAGLAEAKTGMVIHLPKLMVNLDHPCSNNPCPSNKKCVEQQLACFVAPCHPEKEDPYTELLRSDHLLVESIPAIEHKDVLTAQALDSILCQHAGSEFSAIIFTSQTAVMSVRAAGDKWAKADGDTSATQQREEGDRAKRWMEFLNRPVFVVGRATAATCRSILFGDQPLEPDIRGEGSGKATNLLPEIINFCRQIAGRASSRPRLVFFCGDQRRNTLPDGIRESGAADLVEVRSYVTTSKQHADIQNAILAALDRTSDLLRTSADGAAPPHHVTKHPSLSLCLVFFSPSGVRAVAPVLDALQSQCVIRLEESPSPVVSAQPIPYRVAAIGETTMAELVALGISRKSIAVATTPTAEGVRGAICSLHASH